MRGKKEVGRKLYLSLDTVLSYIFYTLLGLLGYKHTMYIIYNTYPHTNKSICEHSSPHLTPWLQFIHSEFPEFLIYYPDLLSPNHKNICIIKSNTPPRNMPHESEFLAFADTQQCLCLFWKHLRNLKGLKVPYSRPFFEISTHYLFNKGRVIHLKW